MRADSSLRAGRQEIAGRRYVQQALLVGAPDLSGQKQEERGWERAGGEAKAVGPWSIVLNLLRYRPPVYRGVFTKAMLQIWNAALLMAAGRRDCEASLGTGDCEASRRDKEQRSNGSTGKRRGRRRGGAAGKGGGLGATTRLKAELQTGGGAGRSVRTGAGCAPGGVAGLAPPPLRNPCRRGLKSPAQWSQPLRGCTTGGASCRVSGGHARLARRFNGGRRGPQAGSGTQSGGRASGAPPCPPTKRGTVARPPSIIPKGCCAIYRRRRNPSAPSSPSSAAPAHPRAQRGSLPL